MDTSRIYGGELGSSMTQNGAATEVQITNEHLQELFRRMPAAGEVMRTILLESENLALKERLRALASTLEPEEALSE
jgi:hypothetical protein